MNASKIRFASTPGGKSGSVSGDQATSFQNSDSSKLPKAPPMPSIWTRPPKQADLSDGGGLPRQAWGGQVDLGDGGGLPRQTRESLIARRGDSSRDEQSSKTSGDTSRESSLSGAGALTSSIGPARGIWYVPPPASKWCKAHGESFSIHGRHLHGAHPATCKCCSNRCAVCDQVSARDEGVTPPSPEVEPKWTAGVRRHMDSENG